MRRQNRHATRRWVRGVVVLVTFAGCFFLPPALSAESWRDDPDVIAARAEQSARATDLYRVLVARYPDVAQLHAEFGLVLFENKQYAEALSAYSTAARLGWRPSEVHIKIAKCYDRLKKFAEAEAEYRIALGLAPDSIPAQFGLATALFNQDSNGAQEKSKEAAPLFEKLAERTDEWGQVAEEFLAQCYFDLGQFDKAAALSRKLVARDPADPAFSWLLARSLYKSRHFSEALALFRDQATKNPKRAVAAHYYCAVCLENLGRLREAELEYRGLAHENSEFGREGLSAARRLAGKSYRFVLDYSGGYDTGIIGNDANGTPIKQKDGFNQVFMDAEARVLRNSSLGLWIGAEHYSLLYPKVHENNYNADAVKLIADVKGVGPFKRFTFDYVLRYAELDSASYRQEHRIDAAAEYVNSRHQFIFGLSAATNKFSNSGEELSGPDGSLFSDYIVRLPDWDHQLRIRGDLDYRWSETASSERFTERIRAQYRAHIASVIYGQLEETFRRDDFTKSETPVLERRIDRRWTEELNFDAQVRKHLFVNWGYLFETQRSTRVEQRYSHSQFSAGLTLTF